MRYLRELVMPHDAHKFVLEEYMQAIDTGIDRVERLVDRMKQLLVGWEWEPVVRALMACKGFQEVAAMTVISELGDLRRFSHPRTLMSFLGLVPGENSSGPKHRQGSITKCGNSHCRWMLVECAQHYRKAPKVGSRDKAIVAIARELSAFISELQVKLNLPMPGPAIPGANDKESTTKRGAAAPDPAERTPARPRWVSHPNPQPVASPLPSPKGGGGSSQKKLTPTTKTID